MSDDSVTSTGVIDRIKCAVFGHRYVAYYHPNGVGIWFGECNRCGTKRTVDTDT